MTKRRNPGLSISFLAAVMLLGSPAPWLAAQDVHFLHGRVVDASTGEPLPGAHVFLANTTLGTTTDAGGTFRLAGVSPGVYEVAASMLGYTLETKTLSLPASNNPLLFRLKERVLHMDEVVVSSTRSEAWYRHLASFTTLLLGETTNAAHCELINPEVLHFNYDQTEDHLHAEAQDALIVINRALGYRMYYYLTDFESHETTVRYLGTVRFEALVPRNRREERRWQRRRRDTYLGSPQHFLSSLYHAERPGDLYRAGFEVGLVPHFETDRTLVRTVDPTALLRPGTVPHQRLLAFEGHLQVIYKSDKPPSVAGVPGSIPPPAMENYASWITLNEGPAPLDVTGHFLHPYAVTMFGLWSRERLAEALPRNYRPD